jgi:DNA-binding transcriptional ArsR family regulator
VPRQRPDGLRRGARALALLFVLAGAASPALAGADTVHIAGTVEPRGTVGLDGAWNGTFALAGVTHEAARPDPSVSARIEVAAGRLLVLNAPLADARTDRGSPVGRQEPVAPVDPAHQVLEDRPFSGVAWVRPGANATSIRFLPAGDGPLLVPASFRQAATVSPLQQSQMDTESFRPDLDGRRLEPAGAPGQMQLEDPSSLPLGGPLLAFAYGADVVLQDADGERTVHTGQRPHEGLAASDPFGWSSGGLYDRVYVVLVADRANVTLASGEPAAWRVHLDGFEGRFAGDATFADVRPEGSGVGDRFLDRRSGLLQVIGEFQVHAAYGSDPAASAPASWRLDGEATFVAADAEPLFGSRLAEAAAVAAAGVGLAALLAALLRHGRDLLAWAGYVRAEPLGNETRRGILRAIAERPGITNHDLASSTGLRRQTVQFHLRILRHAGCIETNRYGRTEHHQLNHGTFAFRAPVEVGVRPAAAAAPGPQETVQVPVALMAIQHPIRRLIQETLADAGRALSYPELVALWAAAGVPSIPSQALFGHHAAKLAEAGVLSREQDGRFARWGLRVQLPEVVRHQAKAFLAVGQRRQVYEFVRRKGLVEARDPDLPRLVPNPGPVLKELAAYGFLDHAAAARSYSLNRKGVFQYL